MKKLTAGILASLIGLVSANSAEAAVASTKYVDDGLATKQQKLTSENFKTDGVGGFVTGVNVDENGNVTFTSANQAEVTVDDALKQDSVNPVQNKVIAAKIAGMAATVPADAGNKVVKSVTQADGTVTASYAQVTGADIAAETIESSNIKNGTIVDADINDVTMAKVTGLDTALAGKQATLTTDNQGDNVQLSFDGQGNLLKISATDTKYETATANAAGLTKLYAETGAAEDGTMTQKAITTELGKKQNTLTAGKFINIDEATGAITTTYSAGTGIKIDDATGAISADNQLNAVTGEAEDGLQVLTRKNCVNGVCEYVWETIDRVYGD